MVWESVKFGVIAKPWLQSSCFKFPFILKPKHKSLGGVVRGRPKDVAWCGPGLHKLLLLLPPPMKSFLLTSHSPWAHMTHTHRHTQTDNRARQNQDMTSYTGREAKWLFSLFFCIFLFYTVFLTEFWRDKTGWWVGKRKDPHKTIWIWAVPSWKEQETEEFFSSLPQHSKCLEQD